MAAIARDVFVASLDHWSASPEGVAAQLAELERERLRAGPGFDLLSPDGLRRFAEEVFAMPEPCCANCDNFRRSTRFCILHRAYVGNRDEHLCGHYALVEEQPVAAEDEPELVDLPEPEPLNQLPGPDPAMEDTARANAVGGGKSPAAADAGGATGEVIAGSTAPRQTVAPEPEPEPELEPQDIYDTREEAELEV